MTKTRPDDVHYVLMKMSGPLILPDMDTELRLIIKIIGTCNKFYQVHFVPAQWCEFNIIILKPGK